MRPSVNISCLVFFNSHSWENDLCDHGNLNLKSVKSVTGAHESEEREIETEIEGMVLRVLGIF